MSWQAAVMESIFQEGINGRNEPGEIQGFGYEEVGSLVKNFLFVLRVIESRNGNDFRGIQIGI
jgi:hypothetical protein